LLTQRLQEKAEMEKQQAMAKEARQES